jgi:probable addiction module antidote protein
MTETLHSFDPAEFLDSSESIFYFLNDALETGDHHYIAQALGVVARAKGITEISEKTGLSREQLYRTLSKKGNPTLKTTLAIFHALGLEMVVKLQNSSFSQSA